MSEENLTKAAILALEGLLVSLDVDIELIAAMPIEEVEEALRQMGLNPAQSVPASIRQLISEPTNRSPVLSVIKPEKRSRSIQYQEARTGRFEDADALYRRGLDAYRDGHIYQAIEYWREAKIQFLYLGMEREIAACDRNIGFALQKLGQPDLAIEQFERARHVYLGIGLEEQVASCNIHIGAAYRALGGQGWR